MTQTNQAYIPGVCNINHAEIASRRKAGHFGLGLFIVVLAASFILPIDRYARLVLFVPAFITAIGYLQARNRFCVAYAAAGQQNADEDSTKAQAIADADAKRQDKRKARVMNTQAAFIALAITLITILLPTR